jgi:hypothetical protein
MKHLYTITFFLAFLLAFQSADAQIVINGYNPRRYSVASGLNALSISYGYVVWVDGNHVSLPGYSSSKAFFHSGFGDPFSVEKGNVSVGLGVAYERKLSQKFAVKGAFSTAKLHTGTASRFDFDAVDKSRLTQFGVYAKYSLTKNPDSRFQFQWLAGPELVYAKKDVFIQDYVLDEASEPRTFRQNVSVLEGALVTGIGAAFKLNSSLALVSEGMIGVSLPGSGFKSTNTMLGVRYSW